jgi:hypothetical protein
MKMRGLLNRIPATLLLTGLFAITTVAQTSGKEIAANLRAQLSEVEARQAEMKALSEQLDEDLKPENIERSLAGVGSTHPEQLREQRQRQLAIARAGVRVQLEELDRSHKRLEAAIAEADAAAYWQSAGIIISSTTGMDKLPNY